MEALSWSGTSSDGILTMSLDAELERYRLLAYLQRVDAHYRERKLYPDLDELRIRIAQLNALRQRAAELETGMVGEVTGIDLQRGEILRQALDNEQLHAVHLAMDQAIPAFREAMERGSELRDELHHGLRCLPIGVMPLDVREGWLILRQGREAHIYGYALPLLKGVRASASYRWVRTHYHASCSISISHGYEQVKAELVRTMHLPNPATFVFESDISLPRIETFMPLAKEMVYELVYGKVEPFAP